MASSPSSSSRTASACRPPRAWPSGCTGACARTSASRPRRAAATPGATPPCPSSPSTRRSTGSWRRRSGSACGSPAATPSNPSSRRWRSSPITRRPPTSACETAGCYPTARPTTSSRAPRATPRCSARSATRTRPSPARASLRPRPPEPRPMTVAERIARGPFVSFELWPPRSAESAAALEQALAELSGLRPAFVAITYGAGGSTRERTHELVARLAGSEQLPLAHLTCAAHGRAELVALLERYLAAGVRDLLALHGDPPLSAAQALPEGDLRYAAELVALAREVGMPSVGVAVHPEGHPAAASRSEDLRQQAAKL